MITRQSLVQSAAAVALAFSASALAESTEQVKVVSTFSILADMTQRIGGEQVSVTSLVGANGDTHVYQPTPTAARAVSEADVLIVNGLEFEGWLDRLIDASDFAGLSVVASKGIEPIAFDDQGDHDEHDSDKMDEAGHDDHADGGHHEGEEHHDEHHDENGEQAHHHHGAFDPHAWQSIGNAITYVDNITAALAQTDPNNAAVFYQNRASYVAELEELDASIRRMINELPQDSRKVVTSHDAFQYFGRDFGLTFLAPQGLSTEAEASAQNVARLIEHMREEGVSAVFAENTVDRRLLQQIARETGATIGGTLYPGALSEPEGPAPTYLDMMRHNAQTLTRALSQ